MKLVETSAIEWCEKRWCHGEDGFGDVNGT
jgi:hypothetical protein